MKLLISTLLLAYAAIAVSCSSPEAPLTECSLENSIKLQTGNWWVYERSEIDRNNKKISGSEAIDSTVVEGTAVRLGKTAYMLVSYITKDKGITYTTDTTWLAVDMGDVYILSNKLSDVFCDCVGPRWVLLADCGNNSWQGFDTTFYETFPALLVGANGKESMFNSTVENRFRIAGQKATAPAVEVGGIPMPVQKYSVETRFRFQLVVPADAMFIGSGRVRTQLNETTLLLSDNLGIVQWQTSAPRVQEIPDSEAGNGISKHLLRYSVK